jgi:predicted lipoprotein with Yx(FWY)xxD motif
MSASPDDATSAAAGERQITSKKSRFGTVLFDGRGQVVYLFDKETSAKSRCYGDCAVAWPPVLTSGTPEAAGEADPSLLGTTTRRDGSTQVTYAGHPLYYYVHDGVGEILCHDVVEFGGLWLVVTPSGRAAA